MQSAGSDPIEGDDALSILAGAERLYVAKGRKTVEVDLEDGRPEDEELLALMLGRTGKLRAPTLKAGKTVVVGFNAELLDEALS